VILGDGGIWVSGLMERISDSWRDMIVLELAEKTTVSVDDRIPFPAGSKGSTGNYRIRLLIEV